MPCSIVSRTPQNRKAGKQPVYDDAMDAEPMPNSQGDAHRSVEHVEETTIVGRSEGSKQPRIHNHDGEPFATVCFDAGYVDHPHHHLLQCGHVIMTQTPQSCAENCKRSTKRDGKLLNTAFACPKKCKVVKVFVPRKRGGRAMVKDRHCLLSHVYGLDAKADVEREEEKRKYALEGLEYARAAQRGERHRRAADRNVNVLARKRSQSPEPSDLPPIPENLRRKPSRKAHAVDEEMLRENSEMAKDPAIADLLETRPADVRRNFMTPAQRAQDDLDQATQRMGKKRTFQEPPSNFREPVEGLVLDIQQHLHTVTEKVECGVCDQQIVGVRLKCFNCKDYNLCNTCYQRERQRHPMTHTFRAAYSWHDHEQGETMEPYPAFYVHCGCLQTMFMVLCANEECQAAFHPGCLGRGIYAQANYQSPLRDECMKADLEAWKGGKAFKCNPCFDAEAKIVTDMCDIGTERAKRAQTLGEKRELANLKVQVKGLQRFFIPGQAAEHDQDLAAAADVSAEIDVETEWVQRLVDQKSAFDEAEDDLEMRFEEPTADWKRGKKRKVKEDDEDMADSDEEMADGPADEVTEAKELAKRMEERKIKRVKVPSQNKEVLPATPTHTVGVATTGMLSRAMCLVVRTPKPSVSGDLTR